MAEYSIETHRVNEEARAIQESPKFEKVEKFLSASFRPTQADNFRLVFKLEVDDQASEFKNEIGAQFFDDLGFAEFTVASEKFLLSRPLTCEQTMKILGKDDHPCTKLKEICLLCVKGLPPKDLEILAKAMTGPFLNADRILAPFLEFLNACANCPPNSIIVRLLHLAQSTGTGKTMLCLYLLETLNNGIYCVYRSNSSSGFPPTNDWTHHLITLFKETTNDSEAVRLCLAFIYAAVNTVRSFCRSPEENLRELFVLLDPSFSTQFIKVFELARLRFKTISAAANEIKMLGAEFIGDFFPIIIDECDEFICYPKTNPQKRISLYRAFRRALIAIKTQKIVAICLGTKSSLNDFVLNYSLDNSARPLDGAKLINPYIFVHSFDIFLTGDVDIAHGALFEGQVMRPESLQQTAVKCQMRSSSMESLRELRSCFQICCHQAQS